MATRSRGLPVGDVSVPLERRADARAAAHDRAGFGSMRRASDHAETAETETAEAMGRRSVWPSDDRRALKTTAVGRRVAEQKRVKWTYAAKCRVRAFRETRAIGDAAAGDAAALR
ncbi:MULTISPECIES: hypothetical protein [Burkholderia]|uniref:hypothetical protein n=1 Tax=Burkholderia TaxID=32008 RepID=UPI001378C69D|nr:MULTISPECIES: hypothetical protein [Burkholderia]